MGYVTKDIAIVTEPLPWSLADNANFLQLFSKPGIKVFWQYNIQINIQQAAPDLPTKTEIIFTEPDDGGIHVFSGTKDMDKVGGNIFYVSSDGTETAENLRQALMSDPFMRDNYDITIPLFWLGTTPYNGRVVNIKSKGVGKFYNLSVSAPGNSGDIAYRITAVSPISQNADSISGEDITARVEMDFYTDPAVFPGQNDVPDTSAKMGTFFITTFKTYYSAPFWMDVNQLCKKVLGAKLPLSLGWSDAGTARAFRVKCRKVAETSVSFFVTNSFWVLNGYSRQSYAPDMSKYVFGSGLVRPLTARPITEVRRDNVNFFNFIFSDPLRGIPGAPDPEYRLLFTCYNTAGEILGTKTDYPVLRTALKVVNTCSFTFKDVMEAFPDTEKIEVCLSLSGVPVSDPVSFIIAPECLFKEGNFIFLNSLGGWDSIGLNGEIKEDFESSRELYSRTVTPAYKRQDGETAISFTESDSVFTITGSPLKKEAADWLNELETSTDVFNSENDRIIIVSLELKEQQGGELKIPILKFKKGEKIR